MIFLFKFAKKIISHIKIVNKFIKKNYTFLMKQTLLISALALSAGLANAQTMMEMPKVQNAAVKANVTTAKLNNNKFVKLVGENQLVAAGKALPVKKEGAKVSYLKPANVFNVGLSHDFYNLNTNLGLYPAYQNITWKNNSEGATGYSWEYQDPESQDGTGTLFSEETDLVAPEYPMTIMNAPTLSATVGGQSQTYQQKYNKLLVGANQDGEDQGTMRYWGGCTYDIAGALSNKDNFGADAAMGLGATSKQAWVSLAPLLQAKEVNPVGFGTIYAKPEVPYMLSYVFVNTLVTSFDPTSEFNLAVYSVSDDNVISSEPLATSTVTGSDFFTVEGNMKTAMFALERKEGELTEMVDLSINTSIYVELTLGKSSAKDQINAFMVWGTDADGFDEPELSVMHLIVDGKESFFNAGALQTQTGQRMRGFTMSLGVTNNWLFERNGKNTYDGIPAEGGSCTFNMNSLYDMEQMANVDGEGMYDWWDVSFGAYDPQTGNQDMTFTFQALPEGVDDRRCMARVSTPGVAEVQYYMSQLRNGGVESVETSASSAQVVDGNFVVSSTAADAVKVYNVSGQLVASANLDGTAVIPAANLAKGLYVVRFNDNTVVKVMK